MILVVPVRNGWIVRTENPAYQSLNPNEVIIIEDTHSKNTNAEKIGLAVLQLIRGDANVEKT